MAKKHLIFDLDGTLLDTIADIAKAISMALEQCGFDRRYDRSNAKPLLGDGADALLRRALSGLSDKKEDFDRLKSAYLPNYKAYQGDSSLPFDGMVETLEKLQNDGVDLFVVTNKPDHLAQIILKDKMPTISFASIMGHKEGNPVKPNPFQVLQIIGLGNYKIEECLFIGDSHVDIDTARNAGVEIALCTWGYDEYTDALLERADYVLHRPSDLLSIVE